MPDLNTRGAAFAEFWRERHLCTLTTVRPDGTPHVVPVGVTLDLDAGIARVITDGNSAKARQVRAAGTVNAAVCQVDGRHWSTLEGVATLNDDPQAIADAVRRYAERYRTPRVNPNRVVLEIAVTNVLGNVS
ncbi:pyridoxamine 5'-phosphate oxidase family protein [Kutzneria buriramensis]|uniref:PPOX class probable F420-dependent enzyme n=1 Tax=Kutzneria buriramensis TaxID=1045776 RepID=A0A3E0H313_9PSEU|nr:TIGR03618 family F420-dependent PPOX class oxidoreductase [Kutzneria buriramensis]REH37280.1 PPOX class probable F420-dependent enzyme [Kutzneria buriramensis]